MGKRWFIPPLAAAILVGPMVGLAGAGTAATTPTTAGHLTVVADHLNNPRQMAWGPDGQLYVAEAGKAGSTCFGPPTSQTCVGFTGALTRVFDRTRVVDGLLSAGGRDGTFTVGADAVSLTRDGTLYTLITSTAMPPPSVPRPIDRQLGNLLRFNHPDDLDVVAQVDNDALAQPTTVPPDTNPYGVIALNQNEQVATDAANNTLLWIKDGVVKRVFVFPNCTPTADAVPTSIARGPDGALYIGQLCGQAAPPGLASVWRWVPGSDDPPRVFRTGFSGITGIAFGEDGNLYVSEIFNGDIVKVSRNGLHRTTLGAGLLTFPGGLAVKGDIVYVSNWSVLPGAPATSGPFAGHNGQVVSFTD